MAVWLSAMDSEVHAGGYWLCDEARRKYNRQRGVVRDYEPRRTDRLRGRRAGARPGRVGRGERSGTARAGAVVGEPRLYERTVGSAVRQRPRRRGPDRRGEGAAAW